MANDKQILKIQRQRAEYMKNVHKYSLSHWREFNYDILDNIMYKKKAGRGKNNTYNDAIIMLDTETSKKKNPTIKDNHVVAWTISIRAFDVNIVTLYGHKPSTCVQCIRKIMDSMKGDETFIYIHNMSYDWIFLRKFMFEEFNTPDHQLNTKSHYPIVIKWDCGLTLKDSLILAQRSLDKWAKDLNVEHQKALGKWDYNKIRNQDEEFTEDELEYIEHDTLAGVECIDATMKFLNKHLYSMPYTATGIPRNDIRELAKKNGWRERFLKMVPNFDQYIKLEHIFHGGFTHANRDLIDVLIEDIVKCFDFSSSYPFVMLSEKYACEGFSRIGDKNIDYILRNAPDYAFMFKLILVRPRLKNKSFPMPALQFSKCVHSINNVLDNGRILYSDYVEIYMNEIDLQVIAEQYEFDSHICVEVEVARKDYLPRWFTDYIFELYRQKTFLKGGDPVAYSIAKSKINSCFGMCVQKCIKDNIEEDYATGEYINANEDPEELYSKYVKNNNSILPYQWCWITSYSMRNLFELGKLCDTWVYSDTDSCYGIGWHEDKIESYNNICKDKLRANNYGCVEFNGREYWLGIAEFDGEYLQFKVQGAKRYCGRSVKDNELHITVAGVPKKTGAICLHDDINNFTKGFIFDGKTTGKLTHTYIYVDKIYTDNEGNETGDSIDLTPCDYLLDSIDVVDFEKLYEEEIGVQVYE